MRASVTMCLTRIKLNTWHKELQKTIIISISRHSKILKISLAFFDPLCEKPKKLVTSFCTARGHLAAIFILEHTDSFAMFHREGLDSSKTAFIDRVQNGKQVSQFCLDHSRARNGGVIWKQLKQTCRTKQRKEKSKVSGYKSQSKQRSVAGRRLLLRTLYKLQRESV